MVENYVLHLRCPYCKKEVKSNWKYCGKCGNLVGNDGVRVKVSKNFNKVLSNESKKASNKTADFMANINQTVNKTIKSAEKIADDSITPLLIRVADGVEVLNFDTSNSLNNLPKHFDIDLDGYHVNALGASDISINGRILDSKAKAYLINGDAIKIGNEIFIYTILDQENTGWNNLELASKETSLAGLEEYFNFNNGELFLNFAPNELRMLNKKAIASVTRLNNFDHIYINGRNFVLRDNILYYQNPLKDHELTSKAIRSNQITADQYLDVDIRKMAVREGNREKTLLKDINFKVKAGEMVLILGGSGAGKTTLINSIMGSLKADATIKIADKNLYDNFDQVKRMIAYVPQFNMHRPTDSVIMTLKDTGQMKLPVDFVKDKNLYEPYLDEILKKLNLYKSKESLVADLSGGEKKRLSIATEYVGDPVLFILDEPDSGLDGSNSRSIMRNLRSIADDNKIVMIISHSPDRTPELFDKVIVLAKSEQENCGQLAFFGSVEETKAYFETDELELVVEKIEDTPDLYIERFRELRLRKEN